MGLLDKIKGLLGGNKDAVKGGIEHPEPNETSV